MNIYQISTYGFLPSKCEEYLPEKYEYLQYFLDYNLKHPVKKFREYLENYNFEPNSQKLNLEDYTLAEIQKIYSVTSILSHIYLELEEPRLQKLPYCLSLPWYDSSLLLGLPCVLTHSAIDLYNWRLRDNKNPFHLENIESINLAFSEPNVRKSEEGFYTSMIAIEGECGPIIYYMDNIYQIIESNSYEENNKEVLLNLVLINNKLERQLNIITQLQTKCKPAHYYHYLRNLIRGSTELYLEGIDKTVSFKGGCANQSSLVQAEDIFFGLNCDLNQKMRDYMPGAHKTYLELMEKRPYVGNYLNDDSYPKIKKQFQKGINLMILLKNQNICIIQKYINVFDDDLYQEESIIENNLIAQIENLGEILDSDLETDSEDDASGFSDEEIELHHHDLQNYRYWSFIKYILQVFYLYLCCLFIVISIKLLA